MSIRLFFLCLVAAALITGTSLARAQNTAAAPPGQSSSVPGPSSPEAAPKPAPSPLAGTVTVPAGTAIPLTLVSAIKSRSTRPGDTVRAMVAFPVTAGTLLAIPAGTYVEGTVTRLVAHTLTNKLPEVEIHFTRMLFANGYAVNLDANSTQARLAGPAKNAPARENARNGSGPAEQPAGSFSFAGAQTSYPPPPTQLPQMNHPNMGAIVGATMGAAVAATIGMLVWSHHRATHTDVVLFDSGWQFQMVLTAPLALDAGQVNAAASTPRGQ